MVDPTVVAFHKDWIKNINRSGSLSGRVTQEDAEQIAAIARSNFADIFAEAFLGAGYKVVEGPGPNVLRVRAGIIDLYINAPDVATTGRSRTYAVEAGEATLFIELRDSTTGALLGRALDRRATRESGGFQMASRSRNIADFRALFKKWAEICVKGLEDLKAQSPMPESPASGQAP